HCSEAQSRLPSTAEELAAFAEECEKRQAARYAAMSPWERIGVDRRDFYPDARGIFDDPLFLECSNHLAPHGGDTGGDLLGDYRKGLRRSPAGDPMVFYRELIRRWGFAAEAASEVDRTIMDEAAVALAFAEFKLRADCRPQVADLARAAIQRQRQ